MASMFKNLCSSMFVFNGNDYNEENDTFNEFSNLDSLLNKNNIPDYVLEPLEGRDCSWKSLGSLFYMRALKLVIGIIQYRAECITPPEELNGTDGILLVADEMKNFQSDYSELVKRFISRVPPSTYKKDLSKLNDPKLKDVEKESFKHNFDISYNNANFYSLSYLNALRDDLGYLYQRTDSAFNKNEYKYSDIFVIGQHLNYGRLSDYRLFGDLIANSSSSSRYKNVSYKGLSTSALDKLNIEAAHLLMEENAIDKKDLVIHAPYLINLANTKKESTFQAGIELLKIEMEELQNLGYDLGYTGFDEKIDHMYELRAHFIEEAQKIPGVSINGKLTRDNAPHIVSVSIEGVRAEVMLHTLEDKEIYVSAGSACSSNKPAVSRTLKSIGLKDSLLDSTIRFSFCVDTTQEEIEYALEEMNRVIPMLQKYTRH